MFPYTVKYTESASDIQNINLLHKIDQQCQNTFDFLNIFEKFKNLYFSEKFEFKMISVLWPAFGGPKNLVYIYIPKICLMKQE